MRKQAAAIETLVLDLARHYFGARAAEAQWQDLARALNLNDSIQPALGEVSLHATPAPACPRRSPASATSSTSCWRRPTPVPAGGDRRRPRRRRAAGADFPSPPNERPDEEGDEAEAPRRGDHIRSFVLRQGRVSDAQRRFHEQGMPRWGIPTSRSPLDLDAVFGRHAHRILEIGCGMGETTATIAAGIRRTTTSASKCTRPASAACSRKSPRANSPTCA
jgi:hypothetical protein